MTDTLSSLHTALIDAREGYRTAIAEASDADLQERLRAVDSLHADAHADIHRILAARGADTSDGGSFMGTVHKAVVSVRSAVMGLDDDALASFASGEEHNLKAYDEAIRAESDPTARDTLTKHRQALATKVADLKRQAERA